MSYQGHSLTRVFYASVEIQSVYYTAPAAWTKIIYIYIYIYIGSISSLMQISLNIIDILCLHIFFWIRSNSRITFIVFGGNWFRYCPKSTRDTYNYGQYINQFPPNTIKVIREFERIQKKICRHKMSIMFNEICINEEMLPKYTYK